MNPQKCIDDSLLKLINIDKLIFNMTYEELSKVTDVPKESILDFENGNKKLSDFERFQLMVALSTWHMNIKFYPLRQAYLESLKSFKVFD